MADEFKQEPSPEIASDEKDGFGSKNGEFRDVERVISPGKGDILGLEHTDPVLNAKMHLVNNVRMPSKSDISPHATSISKDH